MRIAYAVLRGLPGRGGVEKYTLEIGRRLARKGHEITAYVMAGPDCPQKPLEGIKIVPVRTPPLKGFDKLLAAFIAAVRASAGQKYDIVHCHAFGPGASSLVPKLAGIPTIVQGHGIEWKRSRWNLIGRTALKLLERPSVKIPDCVTVVSKVQQKYLEEKLPKAGTVVDFDTATAARALAQKEDKKHAAIASRHAADIYNLLVVDDEIVDDPYNMTRFLILGRGEQMEYDEDTPMLTSILFQTNHTPGSLLGALKAFADNNVNLTKLETYMLSRDLTDPTFYVDVGTALHHPDMQAALKEFKKYTTSCNILGSYPASPHRGEKNSFLPVKAK